MFASSVQCGGGGSGGSGGGGVRVCVCVCGGVQAGIFL